MKKRSDFDRTGQYREKTSKALKRIRTIERIIRTVVMPAALILVAAMAYLKADEETETEE